MDIQMLYGPPPTERKKTSEDKRKVKEKKSFSTFIRGLFATIKKSSKSTKILFFGLLVVLIISIMIYCIR